MISNLVKTLNLIFLQYDVLLRTPSLPHRAYLVHFVRQFLCFQNKPLVWVITGLFDHVFKHSNAINTKLFQCIQVILDLSKVYKATGLFPLKSQYFQCKIIFFLKCIWIWQTFYQSVQAKFSLQTGVIQHRLTAYYFTKVFKCLQMSYFFSCLANSSMFCYQTL